MDRQQILDEMGNIIRDIFDDDTIVVTDNTTAADIEDWDSLEQINILVAAEHAFSVKFSVGEIEGLKNVGELVDLVVKKRG